MMQNLAFSLFHLFSIAILCICSGGLCNAMFESSLFFIIVAFSICLVYIKKMLLFSYGFTIIEKSHYLL